MRALRVRRWHERGELEGRALADVRRRMGFLFQNGALFDSMTVGENVAFPMRRHTDGRGLFPKPST